MKCLIFSAKDYEKPFFSKANSEGTACLVFNETRLTEETAVLATGYSAISCFVNDTLTAAVLDKLKEFGVNLILLRSAGYNHIDLEHARKLNIKVARVPNYSPYSVAEHAAGLILTLNRKLHRSFVRVKEGNFLLNDLLGFDLYQKTVGVVGTGKIGSKFCAIMQGFGCKIIAHDPVKSSSLEANGVHYVTFETVLAESDIISLHCPLNEKTYHMIDKKALRLMKSSVMLINTSRGALLDTKAIIEALKNSAIGSLGIDVYEEEETLFFRDLSDKPIQDLQFARLLTFPNVFITAHQAFFTEEALENIAATTLENLRLSESQLCEGHENFLISK